MEKVIIVAKSSNHVIGNNNDLPWEMPADIAHFKREIKDCLLLTGRASFESAQGQEVFGPGNKVIVITRQKDFKANGVSVVHSVEEALQMALQTGEDRLCILGGGAIYEQTIDKADKLIVTEIHTNIAGDTFFPEISNQDWEEINRKEFNKDEKNPFDYAFVTYIRRQKTT